MLKHSNTTSEHLAPLHHFDLDLNALELELLIFSGGPNEFLARGRAERARALRALLSPFHSVVGPAGARYDGNAFSLQAGDSRSRGRKLEAKLKVDVRGDGWDFKLDRWHFIR